tara:strand:+ start:916 stop:1146 length:231 start_codon:yes stop_codon:yes gene_type:complete
MKNNYESKLNVEELTNRIVWSKERIAEIDKSEGEIREITARIKSAHREIQRLKNYIRWQDNRSRQANTVIKRRWKL